MNGAGELFGILGMLLFGGFIFITLLVGWDCYKERRDRVKNSKIIKEDID